LSDEGERTGERVPLLTEEHTRTYKKEVQVTRTKEEKKKREEKKRLNFMMATMVIGVEAEVIYIK